MGNYQEDKELKKLIGIFAITLCVSLFSSLSMAATDIKIGYVNVGELYNKSAFVDKANKSLQDSVKKMEEQLQTERKKLQSLVTDYDKTAGKSKREVLAKKITSGQTNLTKLTQQFQKKIQEEQNAGMQKFTALVQIAVEKVVKEKHINVVLNNTSIVYTDNSWLDITQDVAAVLQQK